MMTKNELRNLDIAALENEAKSLKKEIFNLQLGLMTGQVKDTSQFRKLRVAIAQALTFARQKKVQMQKQRSKA